MGGTVCFENSASTGGRSYRRRKGKPPSARVMGGGVRCGERVLCHVLSSGVYSLSYCLMECPYRRIIIPHGRILEYLVDGCLLDQDSNIQTRLYGGSYRKSLLITALTLHLECLLPLITRWLYLSLSVISQVGNLVVNTLACLKVLLRLGSAEFQGR